MIDRNRSLRQILRDTSQPLSPNAARAYETTWELGYRALGTQGLHWHYDAANEGEKAAIRLCVWRYRHRCYAFRRFIKEMGWTRKDIKRGFEPVSREEAHEARKREGF